LHSVVPLEEQVLFFFLRLSMSFSVTLRRCSPSKRCLTFFCALSRFPFFRILFFLSTTELKVFALTALPFKELRSLQKTPHTSLVFFFAFPVSGLFPWESSPTFTCAPLPPIFYPFSPRFSTALPCVASKVFNHSAIPSPPRLT